VIKTKLKSLQILIYTTNVFLNGNSVVVFRDINTERLIWLALNNLDYILPAKNA
jgi:hypothetical protein